MNSKPHANRLASLDALRGFDMFWIIGAEEIVAGLRQLNVPGASWLAAQLNHAGWNGFRLYDLVFPLFIFITGVSLVFAVKRRVEKGESRRAVLRHAAKRTITLFLLGIFYNGGLSRSWANIRVMGVLQRIALCYFFASLLVLTTRPRTQALWAAGLLTGYWALLRFVPVPGYGAGVWTPEGNLAHYIDSLLLPGRPYWGTWDPEGLLSTLPAIATCLLGVLAGQWLRVECRLGGEPFSGERKAAFLFLAGVCCVAAGLLAGLFFPINKSIWTSSFALLTGGWSAVLLAVFYWLIDIKGYKRWAFPFVVIGLNSIAIYVLTEIVPFDSIAGRLTGGVSALFGAGRTLFAAAVQLALEWLLLYWLYRRKIFIKL